MWVNNLFAHWRNVPFSLCAILKVWKNFCRLGFYNMLQGIEKSFCCIFSTPCKVWQTCDNQTHTHRSPNTLKRCDESILKNALFYLAQHEHIWDLFWKFCQTIQTKKVRLWYLIITIFKKTSEWFEQETSTIMKSCAVWPVGLTMMSTMCSS